MDQSLLLKILNYESGVFNKFIDSRNLFIGLLQKIEINKLSESQLLNFINDTKSVIDPMITSTQSIDHFINNIDFTDTTSTQDYTDLIYYFLLRNLTSSTELSLDSELE